MAKHCRQMEAVALPGLFRGSHSFWATLDNRAGGRLGGGRGSEAATRLLLACGLTPVRFAAGEMIRKGRVAWRGGCGAPAAALFGAACRCADAGHMARRATSRTQGGRVIEERCSDAANWQRERRGGPGEGQACVTFNLCHFKCAEDIGARWEGFQLTLTASDNKCQWRKGGLSENYNHNCALLQLQGIIYASWP